MSLHRSNRHKRGPSYWRRQIETGRCTPDDPRAVRALARQAPADRERPAPLSPGAGLSPLDARLPAALAATPRARTRHR